MIFMIMSGIAYRHFFALVLWPGILEYVDLLMPEGVQTPSGMLLNSYIFLVFFPVILKLLKVNPELNLTLLLLKAALSKK